MSHAGFDAAVQHDSSFRNHNNPGDCLGYGSLSSQQALLSALSPSISPVLSINIGSHSRWVSCTLSWTWAQTSFHTSRLQHIGRNCKSSAQIETSKRNVPTYYQTLPIEDVDYRYKLVSQISKAAQTPLYFHASGPQVMMSLKCELRVASW